MADEENEDPIDFHLNKSDRRTVINIVIYIVSRVNSHLEKWFHLHFTGNNLQHFTFNYSKRTEHQKLGRSMVSEINIFTSYMHQPITF